METKNVRTWSVLTALALCVLSKVGLPSLVVGVSLAVVATLELLVFRSRERIDAADDTVARRRVMSWLLVGGSVPILFAAVNLLSGVMHQTQWTHALLNTVPAADRGPWHAMAGLGAAGAIALLVSTSLDWCVVRPRLRAKRQRVCHRNPDAQWGSLTFLTQRWLGQRIATYLIVRICGVAFVTVGALSCGVKIPDTAASLLGGLGALLIAYFFNNVMPVAGLVTNPPLLVGDTITLAEEYPSDSNRRARYYVVDVAIEGFKLVEVDGDGDVPISKGVRPQAERSLALRDVGRLLRSRRDFAGCADECARVDRHCPFIDGPRNVPWSTTTSVAQAQSSSPP